MSDKNILLVSGHPAQVHSFNALKKELEKNGYTVFWLATDKDISKYLLDFYKIDYELLQRPGKSILGKLKALIANNWTAYKFIKKNKIKKVVSRVSPYITLAAFIRRCEHFGLSDTESSGIYDTVFSKFLDSFLASTSFKRTLSKEQIRFKGNIELMYLHPNRYFPDEKIDKVLGTSQDTAFALLRFVSWDAYHDKGIDGITDKSKIKIVNAISKYAKVFISSEKKLPDELEHLRISIAPEKMHDVLSKAKIFFGESATMASESVVMGRPAIFLDKYGRGYTDEQSEFGLLSNFKTDDHSTDLATEKALEILMDKTFETSLRANHARFLDGKIDVTAFLVWFVEEFPKSKQIMLENPNYQDRFK